MIFHEHIYESASKVRCQTWLVPVFRGRLFGTGKLHVTFSPGHYVRVRVTLKTGVKKISKKNHSSIPTPAPGFTSRRNYPCTYGSV